MNYEIALTLGLLSVFIIIAVTEFVRIEIAAVAFALLLSFSGIVTPAESFSGFAQPVVLIIAALLVLSAGITHSGLISYIGDRSATLAARMPFLTIVFIMITAAVLGMFVNNTGAVALLLPAVMVIARQSKISPSKVLIPLAFGSVLGGMCTLVGSTTNIIVNGIMKAEGIKPFSFFEFGYIGWPIAAAGIIYMAILGIWFLPGRRTSDQALTSDYKLNEYLLELIIPEGSNLICRNIREAKLNEKYNITVLTIKRDGQQMVAPNLSEQFQANDRLVVEGKVRDITNIAGSKNLQTVHDAKIEQGTLESGDIKVYEATLAPHSALLERTPQQTALRSRFDATILSVLRRGWPIRTHIKTTPLHFGDALLIQASPTQMEKMCQEMGLIVLNETTKVKLRFKPVVLPFLIITATMLVVIFNILSLLQASVIGALLMIVTRCLSSEAALASIDLRIIFVIGGTFPITIAMKSSGCFFILKYHFSDTISTCTWGNLPALLDLFHFLKRYLKKIGQKQKNNKRKLPN